jgi:patatin-like phospholipase/acyl hydrolase
VVAKRRKENGIDEMLYLFRTYDHQPSDANFISSVDNPGEADNHPIVDIGRATSAAPTYFRSIRIGNGKFSDGGFLYNNPAFVIHNEVTNYIHEKLSPEERLHQQHPRILFLSIGTGGDDLNTQNSDLAKASGKSKRTKYDFLNPVALYKHLKRLGNRMKGCVTDVHAADKSMHYNMRHNPNLKYIRWAGGQFLKKLSMDEWKPERRQKPSTQQLIEEAINDYMNNEDRQREIKELADILVNNRRARISSDPDRWQRYSHCTYLQCNFCEHKFNTRRELKSHNIAEHSDKRPTYQNGEEFESHIKLEQPKITGGPH